MLKNKVKISGGRWRGLNINVPLSAHPTSSRVRLAVFNYLQHMAMNSDDIKLSLDSSSSCIANKQNHNIINEMSCCLDLFAGSGLLGFECFSRFDKLAKQQLVFVDNNINAIKIIAGNIEKLKIPDHCAVYHEDAIKFLQIIDKKFELIFLDPPYSEFSTLEQCLNIIVRKRILAKTGIIMIETHKNLQTELMNLINELNLSLLREIKNYSDSLVALVRLVN